MPYFYCVGQPAVAINTLSQIYGWLVAVNNSAAVLTCSDSVGVPTPSFNWTYADIPTIRIAAGIHTYAFILIPR